MTLRLKKPNSDVNPLFIVLSGPSGVGKDATLIKMRELGFQFHYVVTATTRPKRQSEIDDIDYHFISEEQFHKMVKAGQFLEWANVYGNYYGVPKEEVSNALKKGQDVIVKVDVQGAATIKRVLPDAVFIFLTPPSTEELANRLKQRNSQSSSDLNLRLGKASEEMKSLPLFDYVIESQKDNLEFTVSQINAIVTAEKCRVNRVAIKL